MKYKLFLGLCIIFCCLLLTSFISSHKATNTLAPAKFGSVQLSVLDARDKTPINNATVCVIETNEYYQTNKLGITTFSLPAKDVNSLKYSPTPENCEKYTILIYKNGYLSHIYHGLRIQHNITRTGIVILLEPIIENSNQNYTESYDFPTDDWSNSVIDKYRKNS